MRQKRVRNHILQSTAIIKTTTVSMNYRSKKYKKWAMGLLLCLFFVGMPLLSAPIAAAGDELSDYLTIFPEKVRIDGSVTYDMNEFLVHKSCTPQQFIDCYIANVNEELENLYGINAVPYDPRLSGFYCYGKRKDKKKNLNGNPQYIPPETLKKMCKLAYDDTIPIEDLLEMDSLAVLPKKQEVVNWQRHTMVIGIVDNKVKELSEPPYKLDSTSFIDHDYIRIYVCVGSYIEVGVVHKSCTPQQVIDFVVDSYFKNDANVDKLKKDTAIICNGLRKKRERDKHAEQLARIQWLRNEFPNLRKRILCELNYADNVPIRDLLPPRSEPILSKKKLPNAMKKADFFIKFEKNGTEEYKKVVNKRDKKK